MYTRNIRVQSRRKGDQGHPSLEKGTERRGRGGRRSCLRRARGRGSSILRRGVIYCWEVCEPDGCGCHADRNETVKVKRCKKRQALCPPRVIARLSTIDRVLQVAASVLGLHAIPSLMNGINLILVVSLVYTAMNRLHCHHPLVYIARFSECQWATSAVYGHDPAPDLSS